MQIIKDDYYYIDKIIIDLSFICKHMFNKTLDSFKQDELLVDSMLFRLIQVSENAKKISDQFKKMNNKILWSDILGLRNRIVHDYGNIDYSIIYNTLIKDIPFLLNELQNEA